MVESAVLGKIMRDYACLYFKPEAALPGARGHSAPHFFKHPKSAPFYIGNVRL